MDYSLLLGVSTRRKTRKQTVKDKDGWLFVPDSDAIGSRIYSLSLIDYLQEFDFTKYAELMLKRLFKGGGDISSVETQAYY